MAACCAGPFALLPALAVLAAASPYYHRPWWEVLLLGLVDPPARFVATLIAAGQAGPGQWAPSDPACERVSDHDVVCRQSLGFGGAGLPAMALVATRGAADGLVLAGTLGTPAPLARASAEVWPAEVHWRAVGTCVTGARVQAVAEIRVSNGGTAPLFICAVEPNEPRYAPYITYPRGPIYGPGTSTIRVAIRPAVVEQVVADSGPRPLELTVRTNGGVRLVRVGAVDVVGEDRQLELEQAFVAACRVRDLRGLAPPGRPMPGPRGDPAPWERLGWNVVVTGLR